MKVQYTIHFHSTTPEYAELIHWLVNPFQLFNELAATLDFLYGFGAVKNWSCYDGQLTAQAQNNEGKLFEIAITEDEIIIKQK